MKVISRNIPDFKVQDFFSPIRSKLDFVKLLALSLRFLLLNYSSDEDSAKMKLVIDKMNRLFFFKSGKVFSVNFPFTVSIDEGQVVSIYSYRGTNVTSKNISAIMAILEDENFRINPSPSTFFMSTNNINELKGLELMEEMLLCEPSYIRYDCDPDNENGALHPLHHLDVNYSSSGTYKLGLEAELVEGYFEDILNIRTDCYFLRQE